MFEDSAMEIELPGRCWSGSAMDLPEESDMEIELPSRFLSFFISKDPDCGLLPTMKDLAPEDSWVINEILSRLPADLAPKDLGLINQVLSRLPGDSWLTKGILSRLPADLMAQISWVPSADSSSSEDSYVTNGILSSLLDEDSSLPPEDSRVAKQILPPLPDEDSLPAPDDSWVTKHILSPLSGEDLPFFVHLTPKYLQAMNVILSDVPGDLVPQVSWIFKRILSSGQMVPEVQSVVKETLALLPGHLGVEVKWLLNEVLYQLLRNMFNSGSSSIIRPLPDNVAIMILSRLPTKSLARFLCVSSSWLRVIYTMRILKPMSGLFIHRTPCELDQEIYLLLSPQSIEPKWKKYLFEACHKHGLCVLDSCSGFLLLTSDSYRTTQYFICNVSASNYVHIDANKPNYCSFGNKWYFPNIGPSAEDPCPVRCFLAFDPYESPYYRVIRFTQKGDCIRVQIYNSAWRSWTNNLIFSQVDPLDIDNWVNKSVYHQGALHIITDDDELVRFDVLKEIFEVIELPVKHICSREYCLQKRSWERLASCIGVSRGHLYYAVNSCPLDELHIYMLDIEDNHVDKENNMTWRLVHKTASEQLTLECYINGFQPIAFHPASELVYLATARGILSYDPNTRRMVEVCRFRAVDSTQEVYWTEVYPLIFYVGEK